MIYPKTKTTKVIEFKQIKLKNDEQMQFLLNALQHFVQCMYIFGIDKTGITPAD